MSKSMPVYKYAFGETEELYNNLKKLYEIEVNSSIEKSKMLKEYQDKIYKLHSDKMNLLAALTVASAYISDTKTLDTINKILNKFEGI